jgi:hydrogenase expression/formation protein HypD
MSRADIAAMCRKLDDLLSGLGRAVTFMEVCGTHTVAIFRSGLRSLLPKNLRLLSGPGCPVCVTDQSEIDMALSLAEQGCIVLTYGDMLRVPGSSGSLLELKSRGARVEVVTSAMQSIRIAQENPESRVVFLGVGFETTAPATAITLKQARLLGLRNFSVLCLHKRVPPVMRVLCSHPKLNVDGFILPGNVVAVAGVDDYTFLTDEYHKAAAVAGFEPEEILTALVDLARQVVTGRFHISAYRLQDVPREGNLAARKLLSEVFEIRDAHWRGLGLIPQSSLTPSGAGSGAVRPLPLVGNGEFTVSSFSDQREEPHTSPPIREAVTGPGSPTLVGCGCGEVLMGVMEPPECELYGTACTPLNPVGPCMVSSEGTCGTWYRYNRQAQ